MEATRTRRPGFLTAYAKHAGISKQAAGEQLRRVGIDYMTVPIEQAAETDGQKPALMSEEIETPSSHDERFAMGD